MGNNNAAIAQHDAATQRAASKLKSERVGRGLKSAAELAKDKPCGTRIKYLGGCRCDACRSANSTYAKARMAECQAGRNNGVVDAKAARAHLRKLSRMGIGYKQVAAASDVRATTLLSIKLGKKLRIRMDTVRRVLRVDASCRADRALVPAASTWQLINELLSEGFTKRTLAERLGMKTKNLQVGKDRVTVRKRASIEKLHKRLMA